MGNSIHQQIFRSVRDGTMVNLQLTHSWLMEQIKHFVKTENLTPQQYYILRILKQETKPLSTNQIRERMTDKMSDTSRIVERLEAKGLVRKDISERDKRMVDVVITPAGEELLDHLDCRNGEFDNILGRLSDEELVSLNYLLDKLRNHH